MASSEPLVCPRPPTEKPEFTIGTLRKAIPAHCFKRSTWRSFSYLLVDLVAVAALYFASTFIDSVAPAWLAYGALWPLYWFWQGAVCTGIWVIAHECGHGAFSDYTWVNDTVGFVMHSALLVPYYSWKHSHRRHHSNTGSLAKDEVFVPTQDEGEAALFKYTWYRAGFLAVQSLLGWPLYLFFNASGREYSRLANHFDPTSPIFSKRERPGIVLSDLGIAAVVYALYRAGLTLGWAWLVKSYVVPYLIVNFWLVTITFLQHTHPNLPHYEDEEWDWLRGALATVDRSYGILDVFFHRIADTHVAHHLFSQIPHYHAQEVTEAIKPILGSYYSKDNRNIIKALWQEIALCHFVSKEPATKAGVVWFQTATKEHLVRATDAAAAGFDADAAAAKGIKAE